MAASHCFFGCPADAVRAERPLVQGSRPLSAASWESGRPGATSHQRSRQGATCGSVVLGCAARQDASFACHVTKKYEASPLQLPCPTNVKLGEHIHPTQARESPSRHSSALSTGPLVRLPLFSLLFFFSFSFSFDRQRWCPPKTLVPTSLPACSQSHATAHPPFARGLRTPTG